jgi:signal transduction histidine kinase/Tfp pilus assembly protein PilF
MKYIFRFLLLMFILIVCQNKTEAQNEKIDSLQLLLKNSEGTEQIDILNNLSGAYRYSSLNNSLEYANQAIQLAQKNNYNIGEGDGYKNKGIALYFQKKYSEAIAEYEKANEIFKKENSQIKISEILNNIAIIKVLQGEYEQALVDYKKSAKINLELGYTTSVANVYNNIGMVYNKLGDNQKSLEFYDKSLNLSLEEDNKIGLAAAYNNLALVQKTLGKFDIAIEYYQKAIKVNEYIGDKSGVARCLRNMAAAFTQIGEDDKALVLLNDALELEIELNNEQGVLKSYSKIGHIQSKLGDLNNAIKSFEKSLEVAKKADNKEQLIDSYKSLGSVHKKLENYKKALSYYKFSLDIAKEIKQLKSTAVLYYSIGDCYFRMGETSEALKCFKLCVNLSEENNFVTLLEDGYLALARIYDKLEDFEEAFKNQSKYIKVHEDIFSEESQERIAELQTKFETEKKEKEILQLKAEQQIATQRSHLIFTLSGFLVLLIIIALLYNRFLIRKKSIRLLDQKNILLEKANNDLVDAKEKAEESDRLKTAFLANVSHEIRTPMNAIIGFSGFMIDPEVSEQEKEELNELINLNSDLLLNIIDDILDISLIETNQLKIRTEVVDLNKLLEETFLLLKGDKKLKDQSIDFQYTVNATNKDAVLYSDPFRIMQILMNIVGNAIKFTETGSISFGYNIISVNNENKVEFKITDTGIGIDKEYHDLIFKMFYKVTANKSVLYRGTGIGLSIVKSLVNQMGGEVWLHSSIKKGSTFYFTIPLN